MKITPNIDMSDKLIYSEPNGHDTREEIATVANTYVLKMLSIQPDARGTEIKRDLRGILECRKGMIKGLKIHDFDNVPSAPTREQQKAGVKNMEILFSFIKKALSVRAKENQSGTYKILNIDEAEKWVSEYGLKNTDVIRDLVIAPDYQEKPKPGRRVKRQVLGELSKEKAEKICNGLINNGFMAKCSVEAFIYWFCTPIVGKKNYQYKPLVWLGSISQLVFFCRTWLFGKEANETWFYNSDIAPQALAIIFPNMADKKGKGSRISSCKFKENCDKADILKSILDF